MSADSAPTTAVRSTDTGARVRVADVLRDAIRQRLLEPGAPLVQRSLASALGVSKIPVREALHSLASEGLVEFTDEGARVSVLSDTEIHEIWTLRALIEPSMAESICERIGPGDLTRIRTLVEQMDNATDGDEWSDLNYVFHQELYRISAHPHSARLASYLLTLIEPYSRVAVNRLAGQNAAQDEHHAMLDSLESRDAASLADLLRQHSTRARELLASYDSAAEPIEAASPTSEAARAFVARLRSDQAAVAGTK